jgi:hypothetical protein
MAAVAKSGRPSLATTNPPSNCQRTLEAAVDMAAGDAVYIDGNGKFALATGAAANAAAKVWGLLGRDCKAGQFVTAYHSVEFHYGAGLTPAAPYYLSGTVAGGLDTAASTGGTVPIARATNSTLIWVGAPQF